MRRPTRRSRSLEQFFENRQGLGPQVLVAADPRTDSLIVQASPRDMDEVKLLMEQLDAPQAEVNLAQIFKLKNALAIDIAETLEAAIRAVRDGGDRRADRHSGIPGGRRARRNGCPLGHARPRWRSRRTHVTTRCW